MLQEKVTDHFCPNSELPHFIALDLKNYHLASYKAYVKIGKEDIKKGDWSLSVRLKYVSPPYADTI